MSLQPPSCNTGVTPPSPPSPFAASQSQFDWYRATVPNIAPGDLLTALCAGIEGRTGQGVSLGDGKPRWSFLRSDLILDAKGRRIAEVLHGGRNPHPLVEASSENSPLVAEVLRAIGPHRVSRLDVAIDAQAPGLYEQLRDLCEELATRYKLKDREVASRISEGAGATYYLGSRTSEVFFRVYRKGLKIAEEEGLAGDAISDELRNWVRCEIEFKPKDKNVKRIAGTLDPGEFWGVSEWLAEFAERALNVSAEPIQIRRHRPSDHERALRAMCGQYSRVLQRLFVECGQDKDEFATVLLDLANVEVGSAVA